MQNQQCSDAPVGASGCDVEPSKPKVDEDKKEVPPSRCQECPAPDNPAARFCCLCGSQLKVNKGPETKDETQYTANEGKLDIAKAATAVKESTGITERISPGESNDIEVAEDVTDEYVIVSAEDGETHEKETSICLIGKKESGKVSGHQDDENVTGKSENGGHTLGNESAPEMTKGLRLADGASEELHSKDERGQIDVENNNNKLVKDDVMKDTGLINEAFDDNDSKHSSNESAVLGEVKGNKHDQKGYKPEVNGKEKRTPEASASSSEMSTKHGVALAEEQTLLGETLSGNYCDEGVKENKSHSFIQSSGEVDEMQIHFYALLDPAFGSENMVIVFGDPIGQWEYGPHLPVHFVSKCEEFDVIHGVLYLPTIFKAKLLRVAYKYMKRSESTQLYEVITKPKIDGNKQERLNRILEICAEDWKGRINKYDNIVSPPPAPIFRMVRRNVANKSDLDECKLYLKAFLPKLCFSVEPMETIINSSMVVLDNLRKMSFAVPEGPCMLRFSKMPNEDKLKALTTVYKDKITEIQNLMKRGNPDDLQKAFLSSVTLACIFEWFVGIGKVNKEYLTLVEAISLKGFRESGAHIQQILREQIPTEQSRIEVTCLLTILLKEVLEQHTANTPLFPWSMLALVSLLNDMIGKTQDPNIEILLAAVPIRSSEIDIIEVEMALHYAPQLGPLIASKFNFENGNVFLKISSLDSVMLLERALNEIKLCSKGTKMKKLEELLTQLSVKIENYQEGIERIQTGISTILAIMTSLLQFVECTQLIPTFGISLKILDTFVRKAASSGSEKKDALKSILGAYEEGIESIAKSLKSYFQRHREHLKFRFFCELLDLFFTNELCLDDMKKLMDESAERVLRFAIELKMKDESSQKEILKVICDREAHKRSNAMLIVLDGALVEIIHKVEDYPLLLKYLSRHDSSKLWLLFEKVLPSVNKDLPSRMIVVKRLLEWQIAASFIELAAKVLKQSGNKNFQAFLQAMGYFREYEVKFINGDITQEELRLINSNFEAFREISSVAKSLPDYTVDITECTLEEALAKRNEEQKFINDQRERIHTLQSYISGPFIDVLANVQNNLQQDWLNYPISQLCARENGHLKDQVFLLPDTLQNELGRLCSAFESNFFCRLWEKETASVCVEFAEDILDSLFQPVVQEVAQTIKGLLQQSINLSKVYEVFKECSADRTSQNILKEMNILVDISVKEDYDLCEYTAEEISIVAEKVCDFFNLKANKKKLESVIKLGQKLKLKGDFDIFQEEENEINFNMKQATLQSVTDEHFRAAKALDHVTDELETFIEGLLQCMNIINWLRTDFEGFKEVKTFLDLLSASPRESDYEADRVSCLHTVFLEFEPIINLGVKSGPVELIDCCKTMFDKVVKDEKLFNKLNDCNRFLEWFKNERKSIGSVEISTMMDAKAANRRGLYKIGASEPNNLQESAVTLDNSLCLYVAEKKEGPTTIQEDLSDASSSEKKVKIYRLNEIVDLQSKLMLIGGHKEKVQESGQNEKDCFLEMFEAVIRVADLFIKLCESGCIEYLTWNDEFACNLDDGLDSFKRTTSRLEKKCSRLEKDLKEWKLELDRKRTEYPYLNFYTVRQLLMLQTNLESVVLKEDMKALSDLHPQVFSLLDGVSPGIDQHTFRKVLLSSSHRRRYLQKSPKENGKQLEKIHDQFLKTPFEAIVKFIAELEEDHDEDVAKAATMNCGTQSKSKASAWAYDHCEDNDLIAKLASQMDEVLKKREQSSTMAVEECNKSVSGMSATNAGKDQKNYLALDDLGKILDELARNKKERQKKLRTIETMNKRKPNLMTVPKDDTFLVLIDLYIKVSDRLPVSGEVEICNHETSLEKIELLFRRALNDPNGLYTLAFIDELDPNIAAQAYKILQSLQQDRVARCKEEQGRDNDIFNLLLMCSSERADVSFLASACDEYRVVSHGCPTCEEAKEVLTEQLRDRSNSVSAGSADKDCSTVRVIKSYAAGAGKSLFITRIGEKVQTLIEKSDFAMKQVNSSVDTDIIVTTSLQGTTVDQNVVVRELIRYDKKKEEAFPRVYHFDIASTVASNLDSFLFQLLIMGSVSTSTGSIWKKKPTDLYIIEITEPILETDQETDKKRQKKTNTGNIIPLLPTTVCRSPDQILDALKNNEQVYPDPGFDEKEYQSASYQRVYKYLEELRGKAINANTCQIEIHNEYRCLNMLMRYCGVTRPSWREIKHFVQFFDNQLQDCEASIFCSEEHVGDSLPGFKSFVLKFMLQMSKDFATPSVSDQSDQENSSLITLRREWESSEHPYLFFNQDRQSMSFLGFTVNKNGDLMDKDNKNMIQEHIMTPELYQGLKANKVELVSQFAKWKRKERLTLLWKVLGRGLFQDPDPTYELTLDNMMKMLAIQMRFRCGIPVIVMGETGCGKTRLIRFMCSLKAGCSGLQNMILVKVHGGVTESDIRNSVRCAVNVAEKNRGKIKAFETVLFFDEANATSAIGVIKEIMCDKRMAGKPLNLESCGLKIIAACNPYRKHTDGMIKRLESAGLGYSVKSEDASEKLGSIPLRQLVYRVHKLPESMLPLVWDFGKLSPDAETLYVMQIVHRYAREGKIPNEEEFINIAIKAFVASQVFMREQKDECSFVSLRDVERAVQVLAWFYVRMAEFHPFIQETKKKCRPPNEKSDDEDDVEDNFCRSSDESKDERCDEVYKAKLALILALSICYAARLEKKDSYYKRVVSEFTGKYKIEGGFQQMKEETYFCQQMVMDQLRIDDNIAKNTALSENVFMMLVCIELRIPLFVVGKPGSSKSLAKTIVQDNMQGPQSHFNLFKKFKQISMHSYQCSPLSTAEGIISTFKQCSRFQEDKDLNLFASVVVLDEVGLAEDSERMPLKALHPLLEDGTDGSEDLTMEGKDAKEKRVAFIGISNWALDPAKMNRGLMLTRGKPDRDELVSSAEGICSSKILVKHTISALFTPLAKAYSKIYKEQRNCERLKNSKKEEFFGLRDYYSLIKMVFNNAIATKRFPTLIELEHMVKRNFGGLEDLDTWTFFCKELRKIYIENKNETDQDILDVSPVGLLESCLKKDQRTDTRYLLFMTENYAALRVLEKKFPEENYAATVIFGSSFPKDQEFTQVCRDINKIKICMETGTPVILLNMEKLYESLYDALNQYYVYFGGQRYIDLGLGSHRVKCRVHNDFRLIVVAEKSTVYKWFPIPLINRLEKHILVMSTSLTERQRELSNMIRKWAADFSRLEKRKQYLPGDNFIGFNDDTPATVLLEILHSVHESVLDDEYILDQSKKKLLEVATPEAVARIQGTHFGGEAERIWDIYFKEQRHDSLESFLQSALTEGETKGGINVQVTTFSRLLSPCDQTSLQMALGDSFHIKCISLSQFQTEQQFSEELRSYIADNVRKDKILILQCNNGDENSNLIASARHLCHQSKSTHGSKENISLHMIFIVNLKRVAGGCRNLGSFHGVNWRCVHIDELRPSSEDLPSLIPYANHTVSFIFKRFESNDNYIQAADNAMETDFMVINIEDIEEERIGERKMDSESPFIERSKESTVLPIITDLKAKHIVERHLLLGILRRCIHSAIVQTVASNEQRSSLTKKIHTLMNLLSPKLQGAKFNYGFSTVLLRLVYKSLHQKECHAIEKKLWFHDEAATGNNIQECGTFRRALSFCIEKEVIPILSHLISQIDLDSNLDLLAEEEEEWKRDIWLKLFASEEFIRLDERAMVKRQSVRRKGKNDTGLTCQFPFSSAVREKFSSIIQEHVKDDQSTEAERIIRQVLRQSPTGNVLLELAPNQLNSYIHDLVFLEYDVNREEHEMIIASISARARTRTNYSGTASMNIVDIHIIMNHPAFCQRIQCFLSIAASMQNILSDLKKSIVDSDEIIVDALALQKCMEILTPRREDLEDRKARSAWITKVEEIKIVANQLLSLPDKYTSEFSRRAMQVITNARIAWKRIQILKIFVEHICPPGNLCVPSDITATTYFLDVIQTIDDEIATESSWKIIEGALIHLDRKAKCTDANGGKADCKLRTFREKCMSFFMEAVSTILFSSTNHKKDEGVINLMMTYVTTHNNETKEMTPFSDYKVDSSPTIRSFLVQQLLKDRAKGEVAERILQDYLNKSNSSYKDDGKFRLELCILLIHCYEDLKLAEITRKVGIDVQLRAICSLICKATDTTMNISNIDALRIVSHFRVFICKAVEFTYRDVIEKEFERMYDEEKEELYVLLQSTCVANGNENVHEFFLRQFVRNYGLNCLLQLLADQRFHWLWPEINNETHNQLPDRFIVHGEDYKAVREKIGDAVVVFGDSDLEQNVEPIESRNEVYTLLALYREVTTLYLKEAPDATLCNKILRYVSANGEFLSKKVAKLLVENKQGRGFEMLRYNLELEQQHVELAEIVIHALIVFSLKNDSLLLQPLALLAADPNAMIEAYLPTMPSDHLESVFDAGNGNWACYECPNGHLYVITECTRPDQLYNCPDCGAEIGGVNHELTKGNTHAQRTDRTRTGYILGDHSSRIDFAIAERDLLSTSHSLLSVLLHAALVLGACCDSDAVAKMAHLEQGSSDVRMFVWEHLRISVGILKKSLGRSIEDSIILVHLVLKNMLEESSTQSDNFGSLKSKECRRQWENLFNKEILLPVLSNVDAAINSAHGRIINDKRLGSSSLMRRLYEQNLVDNESDQERHPFDYIRFWRYRLPITVTHLRCSLQSFIAKEGTSTCQILQHFLAKVEVLQLVKNLPDITKLQFLLARKLSRQLSSESAKKQTIKEVVKKHFEGKDKKEIENLLKIFYETWRALKSILLSKGRLLQSDDCKMTSSSPVGHLLPSDKATGKQVQLVLSYLAEAHNEIVAKWRKVFSDDETKAKSLPSQEATSYHLVAFDHDKELMPMLYAHCSYSLEIGKGTTIDYNFVALERQLITTFIAGKPLIDVGFTKTKYTDEINNLQKFQELEARIKQRQIPFADQLEMMAEFPDLAQVCDALRAVEIAIGLLSSTGAEPNYFYREYLGDICMDPSQFLFSEKMQNLCRVMHIRSIWTMLTVERAYRMHVSGQDPFNLKEIFRDEVESFDEQLLRLMDLEHLLAELTEYIILEVPLREMNSIEMQLDEALTDFADRKKSEDFKGIEKLPPSICIKHIYSFWKIAADARKKLKAG